MLRNYTASGMSIRRMLSLGGGSVVAEYFRPKHKNREIGDGSIERDAYVMIYRNYRDPTNL
jgi:hypothetical protein